MVASHHHVLPPEERKKPWHSPSGASSVGYPVRLSRLGLVLQHIKEGAAAL